MVFLNSSNTKNVKHRNIQTPKTYERKLSNLPQNKVLPFTPDNAITNLFRTNFLMKKQIF